jgi:hypothetical protein
MAPPFCGAGGSAFAERDLEADVAYGKTSPAGDPAWGRHRGWTQLAPAPHAYVRHTAAAQVSRRRPGHPPQMPPRPSQNTLAQVYAPAPIQR